MRPLLTAIAERRLAVVGDPSREVTITIWKPTPTSDQSAWYCSYLVEGIPEAHHRSARGADSLQALQMAIEGAKAAIEAAGIVCSWGDGKPGDIGIPPSPNVE